MIAMRENFQEACKSLTEALTKWEELKKSDLAPLKIPPRRPLRRRAAAGNSARGELRSLSPLAFLRGTCFSLSGELRSPFSLASLRRAFGHEAAETPPTAWNG
jgi:hypothetical protein